MLDVTVSVDDRHLDAIDGVVEALGAAGMRVTEVLGDLGVITGSVEDDAGRSSLVEVPGVTSADAQVAYQLPPPDADIQ